jgi:hypothetical protein
MLNLSDSLSLVGEQGAYGIISKNLVDEKFYISNYEAKVLEAFFIAFVKFSVF